MDGKWPGGTDRSHEVRREVAKDEVLRYQDVVLDESSLLVRLRRQQDSLRTTQGQTATLSQTSESLAADDPRK